MRLVADLHVHSRYSRATSRDADLDGYYRWARLKGINLVGTGDFTHPRWMAELSERLVEKDGLFELKEPPGDFPLEDARPAESPVRFVLTVEISSIYRKHGETRKVHTLIGVRTLEQARRLSARLAAIGNIASDGRPILGLDPKDLLSMQLETAPEGFLIPAHVWTPWFSLFGSKSGFDRIEDCFEELTPHIFALETGLSSDPPMNWRWSALDRYRLVSNSDAHSPPNLGREATLLEGELCWESVAAGLRDGRGFLGTCEFYPEEGKYHFDGHRKCGVCMDPADTLKTGGKCPACGSELTIGVLHRVLELCDRQEPRKPERAGDFRYLIPVPEILAQLTGSGAGSRTVATLHAKLIRAFGSEYAFLFDAAPEDIRRSLGSLIAEAVGRMRDGRVSPSPGYDGEFGVIRMFDDPELARLRGQDELFPSMTSRSGRVQREALPQSHQAAPPSGGTRIRVPPQAGSALAAPAVAVPELALGFPLDEAQQATVDSKDRRSLVFAGPGTGKTRLLTSWIASRIQDGSIVAHQALALTFTNRAAAEMRDRLFTLLGGRAAAISTSTFHSFCFGLLRTRDPGLLTVYSPAERVSLLGMLPQTADPSRARVAAERLQQVYEGMADPDDELRSIMAAYDGLLKRTGGVDVSSLVVRVLDILRADPDFLAELHGKYRLIAVDELQDINRPQAELLSLLCASDPLLLCIGDPDQAIYGFRGSDRSLFFRLLEDRGTRTFALATNYRSSATLVSAAAALIAAQRSTGIPALKASRPHGPPIQVFAARDPGEEGDYIASTIRDLVGGVDSVSVDAARTRSPGTRSFADIAVLFRTRAVRDALLPSLVRAGLPLTFRDNRPIADEPPFRFLVAGLRLILNSDDPVSRKDLAGSVGTGAAEAFVGRIDELRGLAARAGVEAIIDELEKTLVTVDRSVPEVFLGDEAIRESAREHASDLSSFLAGLSLLTRESEGGRSVERVTLLTFHAAKGLEFPVVFIAGAEDGIVPLPEDPEEERRLFYVALTRAREVLHITHCARRVVRGSLQPARPSPFLAEIPGECRQEARGPSRSDRRDAQLSLFG